MAFTYTNGTARGQVRLMVADVNTADATKQIFNDAEIDDFLTLENQEVYPAAAAACRSIAADTSRSAVAYTTLNMRIDRSKIPDHYRALAKDYMARATAGEPSEFFDYADVVIDTYGRDLSEYDGDTF